MTANYITGSDGFHTTGESGYARLAYGVGICNAFVHGGLVTVPKLVGASSPTAAPTTQAKGPTASPTLVPVGWDYLEGQGVGCRQGPGYYNPKKGITYCVL